MLFPAHLTAEAAALLEDLRNRGLKLATAESCTGGLIAGLLTEIAGSSDVIERGFVSYSNTAKTELLGVPEAMLAEHGAVSEPVARAMAAGALARSHADLAALGAGGELLAGPRPLGSGLRLPGLHLLADLGHGCALRGGCGADEQRA